MLTELAAIKKGNELTGFILSDGKSAKTLSTEDTIKYLKNGGKIDTIGLAAGNKLKPIGVHSPLDKIQGKSYQRVIPLKRMSMKEYLQVDTIFRWQDIGLVNGGLEWAAFTIDTALKLDDGRILIILLAYMTNPRLKDDFGKMLTRVADRNMLSSDQLTSKELLHNGNICQVGLIAPSVDVDDNMDVHPIWRMFDLMSRGFNQKTTWNENCLNNYDAKYETLAKLLKTQDMMSMIHRKLNEKEIKHLIKVSKLTTGFDPDYNTKVYHHGLDEEQQEVFRKYIGEIEEGSGFSTAAQRRQQEMNRKKFEQEYGRIPSRSTSSFGFSKLPTYW